MTDKLEQQELWIAYWKEDGSVELGSYHDAEKEYMSAVDLLRTGNDGYGIDPLDKVVLAKVVKHAHVVEEDATLRVEEVNGIDDSYWRIRAEAAEQERDKLLEVIRDIFNKPVSRQTIDKEVLLLHDIAHKDLEGSNTDGTT